MRKLKLALSALAVTVFGFLTSTIEGGAAALPATFTIRNAFETGGNPTRVLSDEWSGAYIDNSLPSGDPCVDAFGGRANTFLAVNWNESSGSNCTPPEPLQVRRFSLTFDESSGVCPLLQLALVDGVCKITSGPDPRLNDGNNYGARPFRIRASDLFTSSSAATRVDFLLETVVAGAIRGFEVRTDAEVLFAGTTGIKKKYDPSNFFKVNHNIMPAP